MTSPPPTAEALGRRVVAALAPDELPHFDLAAAQFRRAPRRPPSADVDDRLGFGVEIGMAVTSSVLWLSQVALDAAREETGKQVGTGVAAVVARLFAALRRRFGGPPPPAAPPALTPAEIRHVRGVVRTRAVEVGHLAPEQAERIADAIAAALLESA